MKLSRESFLHDVQAICHRPQMYTKNGTFGEVLAFIQGIALGSRVHGSAGSHAGIQDFFHWLEKKVGNHPDFRWRTIESFYAMYSDDETALKDFAKYYAEFCNEIPDEEDEIEITITESKAQELCSFISSEEKFSEIQEKIKERLYQNSNNRNFLAGEYNIFKKVNE
jgi:hypothetical protein